MPLSWKRWSGPVADWSFCCHSPRCHWHELYILHVYTCAKRNQLGPVWHPRAAEARKAVDSHVETPAWDEVRRCSSEQNVTVFGTRLIEKKHNKKRSLGLLNINWLEHLAFLAWWPW